MRRLTLMIDGYDQWRVELSLNIISEREEREDKGHNLENKADDVLMDWVAKPTAGLLTLVTIKPTAQLFVRCLIAFREG